MRKKIAIITGASSGLGKDVVALIIHEEINEIWCIAKDILNLPMLKKAFMSKIVTLSFDVSKQASITSILKF